MSINSTMKNKNIKWPNSWSNINIHNLKGSHYCQVSYNKVIYCRIIKANQSICKSKKYRFLHKNTEDYCLSEALMFHSGHWNSRQTRVMEILWRKIAALIPIIKGLGCNKRLKIIGLSVEKGQE